MRTRTRSVFASGETLTRYLSSLHERSARWHHWRRLMQLSRDLEKMHNPYSKDLWPPGPARRWLFLELMQAFADPTQREILRTVILDLLGDDLVELLKLIREEVPA